MWFVVGGIVLVLLWFLEIGPLAHLAWGWLTVPFILAVVWWSIAESTGYTQRTVIRKLEERKIARRERDMAALGLTTQREEAQHQGHPRPAQGRCGQDRRRAAAGRAAAARSAAVVHSPSSTAPRLALLAFFANLPSTPRV